MYEERNTDALSLNHCCRWKARSITYSECVSVVLVVQYEKRMHSIIYVVSCVTYTDVQYFPTLSQKVADFGKIVIEKNTCLLIFCTLLFETLLTLWRIRWDM